MIEDSLTVYLTFSILNFCEAILGIGLGVSYRDWSGWAWIGHSSYTLMILLTSVWIWFFYGEAVAERKKTSFYTGAQTLKWYMYAANWIPVGFLTYDFWV